MPRVLDLASWPRRPHYEFFRGFEQPFWNVCFEADVTRLVELCRGPGAPSFFLASLHLSLTAVNAVENLRYRLRAGGVVEHEVVHGGSTVLRPDQTFAFAYFDYQPQFSAFAAAGRRVLDAAREGPPRLEPRPERDDMIHYSVLPWLSFTSFQHARHPRPDDSVPKVVFGRYAKKEGRQRMPVSIEVHHALVDGFHVGRFAERFQGLLDAPALE